MSSTLADQRPRAAAIVSRHRAGFFLFVGSFAVLTAGSAVVFNGDLILTLLPSLALTLLYALWRLPLRIPLLVMTFIGLTFENPGDVPASGLWKSPLYPLGKLLLAQLKHSIPVGALVMTGSEVVFLIFAVIYVIRRITGSRVDIDGLVPTPKVLIRASLLSIFGAILVWVWGAMRGGQFRFALWQVHHVIYVPVLFLLLQAAIARPEQLRPFGRVVIFAACLKAVLAVYLRGLFPDVEYVTTHHDSMLFALATVILVASFLEHPGVRELLRCLLILPILCFGMIANDRRLVWVEIGVAAIFMFVLARRTKLKIKVVRTTLALSPLLALYVALGWGGPHGIFRPVNTIRSMFDSKTDMSSEWRDLENFNLVKTVTAHPIMGTGFGHPFEFAVKMPDIMKEYELEPYLPHNSMLGLWAYGGYVGFCLIWSFFVVILYFAARAYRSAETPFQRTCALSSFCMLLIYFVHLYGDMALGSWTSIYLVGLSAVAAGKVAVQSQAWRVSRSRELEVESRAVHFPVQLASPFAAQPRRLL